MINAKETAKHETFVAHLEQLTHISDELKEQDDPKHYGQRLAVIGSSYRELLSGFLFYKGFYEGYKAKEIQEIMGGIRGD